MKILQVSNIVSHHQIPLASQLAKMVGVDNFRFAALSPVMNERIKMGWGEKFDLEWILNCGDNDEHKNQFLEWWFDADVVICGERLVKLIKRRIEKDKLCFYTSERWFKPRLGKMRLLHPSYLSMALKFREFSKNKNFYFLAKGVYAAEDIQAVFSSNERVYKWGYFTESNKSPREERMLSGHLKILWVGRFVDFKNLEVLIYSLKIIKTIRSDFQLTLIGDGPRKKNIEEMVANSSINENVNFRSSISSSDVHKEMREHDVYVFPSNFYEGWGAVVNEAMSSGLAVVASKGAGASVSMIEDGKDGYLFDPFNIEELSSILLRLLNNREEVNNIGMAAKNKIDTLWSPEVASKRFLDFAESKLKGCWDNSYENGPLSKF